MEIIKQSQHIVNRKKIRNNMDEAIGYKAPQKER